MKIPEAHGFYLDDESNTVFVSGVSVSWGVLRVDGSIRPTTRHPGRPPLSISSAEAGAVLEAADPAAEVQNVFQNPLERAIQIAASAHAGKVDKAGAPYILHVLRVMLRMTTDEERIVAVLHDVVEDTGWTINLLRVDGFSASVLRGIDSVTHREGESYEDFVARAGRDPLGRRVKLADLEDNSDLGRFTSPSEEDRERIKKYRRAIEQLRS